MSFEAAEGPEPPTTSRTAERAFVFGPGRTGLYPPADYLEDGDYDVFDTAGKAADKPVALTALRGAVELGAAMAA